VSEILKEKMKEYFTQKNFWKNILVKDKYIEDKNLEELNNNSDIILASIVKVWKEMLGAKKDPIARILRYILYKYE
jgi:hypothetical protein